MKKNSLIYCAFAILILFSGCFSPWLGDDGNLTIVLGGSNGARFAFWGHSELVTFRITLTGPGPTQVHEIPVGSNVSFKVIPGSWVIKVVGGRITNDQGDFNTLVMGIKPVEVKAGRNSIETVELHTYTRADHWDALNQIIHGLPYGEHDDRFDRTQIVVLRPGSSWHVGGVGVWPGAINIDRQIILVAEEDITITRNTDFAGSFLPIKSSIAFVSNKYWFKIS